MFVASFRLNGDIHPNDRRAQKPVIQKKGTCDENENEYTMRRIVSVCDRSHSFSMGRWHGRHEEKVETVRGQAENVKKEGGEAKQSAQDMKAQDAMKNTGEMKDEGKKLKDAATGK